MSVWGNSYEYVLKPLKVLQNRLVHTLSGVDYRASAPPIYQQHKLLKIDQIQKYMFGAFVFKSINNDLPCAFE